MQQGDKMKIGKYTKLKGNKYSVVIDDITVKLYDDDIWQSLTKKYEKYFKYFKID